MGLKKRSAKRTSKKPVRLHSNRWLSKKLYKNATNPLRKCATVKDQKNAEPSMNLPVQPNILKSNQVNLLATPSVKSFPLRSVELDVSLKRDQKSAMIRLLLP